MNKSIRSESGFAHLLLVVVLVAVIGAVTYFAYQARMSAKKVTSTPIPSASNTPIPSPDLTLGWKAYSSTVGKYSVKYPSSWVTSECDGNGTTALSVAPSSKYLAVCNSDGGGEILVISRPAGSEYNTSADGGTKVTTVSGLTGTVVRTTNGSFMSPDYKIAVSKTYVFKTNGRIYEFSYMQDTNRGFPDNEADFDRMVEKTFRVN